MKVFIKVMIIVFSVIAVIMIAITALVLKFNYKNEHYYKYTETGGSIEEKYTAMGTMDVSYTEFEAENSDFVKYEVWYPSDMQDNDNAYPLVVMVNGTGIKASQYKEIFKHLASWGFVVIGNEDNNSRTGASSAASLDFMLNQNKDNDSVFYGKIDTENIGIGGHSEGGVGTINAVTAQENGSNYKAMYTASATSPYWGQDDVFGKEWSYDASKINIPCFMVAGTKYADAGEAEDITLREKQGICPLWGMNEVYNKIPDSVAKVMARKVGKDHGDMLRCADGYMTAWFMYWLKDNKEAGNAFFGDNSEISQNEYWQDTKINP